MNEKPFQHPFIFLMCAIRMKPNIIFWLSTMCLFWTHAVYCTDIRLGRIFFNLFESVLDIIFTSTFKYRTPIFNISLICINSIGTCLFKIHNSFLSSACIIEIKKFIWYQWKKFHKTLMSNYLFLDIFINFHVFQGFI